MSAIQMETRRYTATHCLDFMASMSVIQIELRRCRATHSLDHGWDFMACMLVIEMKNKRCTLTAWMGFYGGHVSSSNER
jgi:hypothetical protein